MSSSPTLPPDAWRRLIQTVFKPFADERTLAILVDLPDAERTDHKAWRERRELAAAWHRELAAALADDGLSVEHWYYPNAGTNNGDLPDRAWTAEVECHHVAGLPADGGVPFTELFDRVPILIAMSEFSATAPLKVASKRHGFRAATMPRFSPAMMPALDLDLGEVDRRCQHLKALLDVAVAAHFAFEANGHPSNLRLDLRHRTAHASSGLLHSPGTAGNLPSGETYIVPYEGELADTPSQSAGFLPVAFGADAHDQPIEEVVTYEIRANRAVSVKGDGPVAAAERQRIADEPAYANLSELGLGVLGDLGISPIGEILLDEKLGLHIAFGRSDHFGGSVGPADFSSPEAVVHIDRVYLPGGAVAPKAVDFENADGRRLEVLRDGRYVLDFNADPQQAWS